MPARRTVRPVVRLVALLAGSAALAAPARAQLPGENVNMVSGTQWPGGDPFLQRQNEPSIAVSSANALHLLAGANDYRTVDLPNPFVEKAVGDAWLGVFKSFDGGQTWRSVLLPGYPQDTSTQGLASPLRGFTAAADPVVRAGTDGLFYYSGITFNRGTNRGQVFVSRFIDKNNKENGDPVGARDPIRYLGAAVIDSGTSGQFLDKPWLAVDVPRAGARLCTVPADPALPGDTARTFPGGVVYFSWATFTGSNEQSSKVMFTRSLDCGQTWENPQKLSESNSVNQGTVVAVDPVSGTVHVAWRRFATSSEGDAILYARSVDAGRTFTKAVEVASVPFAFDQPVTGTRFRALALPTLAVSVDASGTQSWVHLAWAERPGAGADARIVMKTSANGTTWPATTTPVSTRPLVDDAGRTFSRGQQLMPALTFTQGRLMLVYYDTRLDHTRGYYQRNPSFLTDPAQPFFLEKRGPLGELVGGEASVFTPLIDDAPLTQVRHTIDVVVGEALPGPSPVFSAARVSQYRFGTRGDEVPLQTAPGFDGTTLDVTGKVTETDPITGVQRQVDAILLLQQLQVNPPNLPMFKQGTVPFMGDYIDINGPAFVHNGSGWAHNTAPTGAPVHHAVWTSNQDVRPPPRGIDGTVDWTRYTPVGGGGQSIFDPTQSTPVCRTGYEGTRNQNIYTSRITSGLAVSSPQNAKPLSPTLTRAFVVIAQNATDQVRAVRFSLAAPLPAGVSASFRNDQVLQSFGVEIPPRSAVHRSVFVLSSVDPAATLNVRVEEISGTAGCLASDPPDSCLVSGGLAGFVTLNPPGSVSALVTPDGTDQDPNQVELYFPLISSANVTSANVTSANVTSANVTSANVTSANVTSANVTSTHVANPDLANVTSANVTSANVTSANVTSANVTSSSLANVTSANVTSANVTSANVTSASLSDANYTVTNEGNTTHSYHVKIVGTAPAGAAPLQLIVSKPYSNPIALGCELVEDVRNAVIANVENVTPAIVPDPASFPDPNIPDPRTTNATLTLAPGETAQITLRGAFDLEAMRNLTGRLAPAVVPHAGGGFAAPLFISSDGSTLPVPRVGVFYSAVLQASGGSGSYVWTVGTGSLPAGLALAPDGTLSGTPSGSGTSTFGVTVSDGTSTATASLTLTVVRGPSALALSSSPNPSVSGQPVTFTATLSPATPPPTGTVTFRGTSLGPDPVVTVSAGKATLTVASLPVGVHAVTASYSGDGNFLPASSAASISQTVVKASTATSLALVGASPPAFGQPMRLAATVSVVAPGAGTPAGLATFKDGATLLGTAPLVGGVATLDTAPLGAGGRTFTASYAGDGSFLGSGPAALPLSVSPADTAVALAVSPASPVQGQTVVVTATVTTGAPGAGTPTGTVEFLDGTTRIGLADLGSGGTASVSSSLGAGSHALTAAFQNVDGNFSSPAYGTTTLTVGPGGTTTTVAASPASATFGQAVTLTATVASVLPATGTPRGEVTFLDGTTALGSATLAGGVATLQVTTLAVGAHAIRASYGGEVVYPVVENPVLAYLPSDSAVSAAVSVASAYRFTGFLTPLKTAGTFQSPTYSGIQKFGSAIPVKWQLQDASGAFVGRLSTARSLEAWQWACPGAPPFVGTRVVLYAPTSGATGGSTFRFSSDTYIFNWDTTSGVSKGCYNVVLTLDDGTQKATIVKLQ